MKKLIGIFLIVSVLFSFTSCTATANNEEEMFKIIKKKESIPEKLLTQSIGKVDLGDKLLMCVMTGNENQGNQYYAVEFKRKKNKYKFVHSYKLYERGMDMYSLLWADGYIFISNNENSKSLQIRFLNDEQEELIAINEVPFVYYLDLSERYSNNNGFSFEYYFFR